MGQQDGQPWRDLAALGLAAFLSSQNPEAARRWEATVTDRELLESWTTQINQRNF
jgi:hypothetical protein